MKPLADIAEHWSLIGPLLDQALALPPQERAGWLASLSGEQAAHREALQALLKTHSDIEASHFLNQLPALPSSSAPGAAEPQAGDMAGPYRLLHEIGRGGMGYVWLAERDDALTRRRVALKLPRVAWGQNFAERLAREREILATLEHEHIARLYDAGLDAHGRPYLAMQYVEGATITAYAEDHRLALAARIGLLLQVMSALAHAHARLVVHRDLKPGNILVSPEGSVTLLDFGVAKLLEGDRTAATALTELAGRALTPDYASPEQVRGAPLGTASDIYSLGVVAYELLAGTRPYRLRRGSAAELEAAILEADPPLASDAATQPALKKALRGDLDAILNRALKKDEAARYASVDAFAHDLQRYLQGEPVQARPDSRRYRLARFVGRHRLAVGLGSALTAAVLAGSAVSLWQAQQARAQERRASSEVKRQRAVQDLYIETLSRLAVLSVEQPEQVTRPGGVSSVLVAKLAELEQRTAQRPDERAAQLESVMLQLNFDSRFAESLAVGERLLAHLKANGATPDRVINTYGTQGRTLFQLGRRQESEAARRAGLAWAPQAHDLETERVRLIVAADLGGMLIARGKRSEARQILVQAEAAAARYFASEHLRFDPLMRLAMLDLGFDDAQALQRMREARAELKGVADADADSVSQVSRQLADALLANGLVAESEAAHNEAMAIYRRESGRDSREAVRAFGRLVGAVARSSPPRAVALLEAEGQWLAARPGGLKPQADRVLRARLLETAWLAGDTATAAKAADFNTAALFKPATLADSDHLLVWLARALVQAGRPEAALSLMQALHAQWPEPGLATVAWLRIELTLAEVQLAAGQPAEVRQTTTAALTLMDQAQGQRSRSYRQALALGAQAAAQQGDAPGATALLQRLGQQVPPPFPSPVEQADCDLHQALALKALGRAGDAKRLAQRVLNALSSQHPQSPRLALARNLAEG